MQFLLRREESCRKLWREKREGSGQGERRVKGSWYICTQAEEISSVKVKVEMGARGRGSWCKWCEKKMGNELGSHVCVVSANFDHVVEKTAGCLQRGCKRQVAVYMHGTGDSWLFTGFRRYMAVCLHGSGYSWLSAYRIYAYMVQEKASCHMSQYMVQEKNWLSLNRPQQTAGCLQRGFERWLAVWMVQGTAYQGFKELFLTPFKVWSGQCQWC